MFGKKSRGGEGQDDVAMRIVTDGRTRDVSFKELVLSTNMSLEALMSVLIRKGILTPEDLLDEIESRKNQGDPDPGKSEPGNE